MFLKTLLINQIIFFTHAAYDRCELARTLVYEHYFDNQHIADWMCIAEHGRNFNKDLPITTESSGHGLLQIPSLWCQNSQECVTSCRGSKYDDHKGLMIKTTLFQHTVTNISELMLLVLNMFLRRLKRLQEMDSLLGESGNQSAEEES